MDPKANHRARALGSSEFSFRFPNMAKTNKICRFSYLRIRLAREDLPVVKLVSVVVGGDDVQQQYVFGFGIEPGHAELHLRKHLPGRREKNRQLLPPEDRSAGANAQTAAITIERVRQFVQRRAIFRRSMIQMNRAHHLPPFPFRLRCKCNSIKTRDSQKVARQSPRAFFPLRSFLFFFLYCLRSSPRGPDCLCY